MAWDRNFASAGGKKHDNHHRETRRLGKDQTTTSKKYCFFSPGGISILLILCPMPPPTKKKEYIVLCLPTCPCDPGQEEAEDEADTHDLVLVTVGAWPSDDQEEIVDAEAEDIADLVWRPESGF